MKATERKYHTYCPDRTFFRQFKCVCKTSSPNCGYAGSSVYMIITCIHVHALSPRKLIRTCNLPHDINNFAKRCREDNPFVGINHSQEDNQRRVSNWDDNEDVRNNAF